MLASLTQNSAKVEHIPYHQTRAGWVAVWPLVGQSEEGLEVTQSWQVPAVEPQRNHPEIILARQIASTIASWLNDGRMLVSKQRPLSPGDILILVRKRNQFIDELVRELKALQIPASGSDRLKLQDSLAIQDMLALMRFVALPDDDFSLAAVLKGPLCAVSEEQLFKLAYARGKTSLWERLLNEPEQADIAARLKRILAFADGMRPAKLLGFVLDSKPGRAAWYARQGDEALDMFAALLSLAEEYEQTSNASLEGFINFVENYEESVKRILEQNQQMVRIMTAHGAKGLQAPIVFVADSVVPPRNRDTFCWLGAEPALPVIYSKDNNALPAIAKQLAEENCRQLDEYRRLFYVAITRAECGLVLCGAAKRNEVSELSWYSQGQAILEHGLGDLDSVLAPGEHVEPSSNPPVIMPEFAEYKQTAQEEEHLLLPSLLGERAEASAQMQLGLLLHQVLEFAERYRSDHAALLAFLTNHQAEDFYAEMLSTLKDPHLEAFLAPTSIAEVPLYGTIIFAGKQRLLSGRIDRLLVQEDRVLFIDFKTHRQPPKALTASMLSQMQLYQAALIQMYPQKQVRGYIYFTATQELRALQSEMV